MAYPWKKNVCMPWIASESSLVVYVGTLELITAQWALV